MASQEMHGAPGGDGVVHSFSITVDGIPSGFASLEIDSAGLPLVREQTVGFPTGEMRVLEEYRWVVFTP